MLHISKSESVYWKCHLIESDLEPCIGWQCTYKFTLDSHSKVARINIMRHLHGRTLEIMHHANDVALWMRWFEFSPHPSSPSHPRGLELRLCSHIHFFPPCFACAWFYMLACLGIWRHQRSQAPGTQKAIFHLRRVAAQHSTQPPIVPFNNALLEISIFFFISEWFCGRSYNNGWIDESWDNSMK